MRLFLFGEKEKVAQKEKHKGVYIWICKLSAETNHSRNELINLILAHGVENIEIQ